MNGLSCEYCVFETGNDHLFFTFSISFSKLSSELRSLKDAIIRFSIKDKHTLGSHCIAEGFLSFAEIKEKSEITKQMHLPLTRFDYQDDLESLKMIKLRSNNGDKAAKEFLGRTQQIGERLSMKWKPS